jgi:hypothetical protein
MNKLSTLLGSIGLGAGLMYFLDPEEGNRRRALVRDQAISLLNTSDQAIDKTARDLRNRTRGALAEAIGSLEEGVPDPVIEQRVRSRLGQVVRNPGVVDVSVDEGQVTVRGPALADEHDFAVSYLASTRGAREFVDRFEVIQKPEDAPGLETAGPPPKPKFELMQENWSPTARLFTTAGGGMLALYGMIRRGFVGSIMAITGMALATRGLTNTDLKELFDL